MCWYRVPGGERANRPLPEEFSPTSDMENDGLQGNTGERKKYSQSRRNVRFPRGTDEIEGDGNGKYP